MVILYIFIAILALFFADYMANSFVSAKTRRKYRNAPGTMIQVRPEEYVHAASFGEGKYTIVMLSGMGTASPYCDFYYLADKMSRFARVIILELPGYGYSSHTNAPRTLDNYDKEITAALDALCIHENVILMPHSYSGPISLYYSKQHKELIKGIMNIDVSVASQYVIGDTMPWYLSLSMKLLSFGLFRILYRKLARKDIEAIVCCAKDLRQTYADFSLINGGNSTIILEYKYFPAILKELLGERYDEKLYVRDMVSCDETSNNMLHAEMKKKGVDTTWQDMHKELITNEEIQKTFLFDAPHYLHHKCADEMVEIAEALVKEMEEKDV